MLKTTFCEQFCALFLKDVSPVNHYTSVLAIFSNLWFASIVLDNSSNPSHVTFKYSCSWSTFSYPFQEMSVLYTKSNFGWVKSEIFCLKNTVIVNSCHLYLFYWSKLLITPHFMEGSEKSVFSTANVSSLIVAHALALCLEFHWANWAQVHSVPFCSSVQSLATPTPVFHPVLLNFLA